MDYKQLNKFLADIESIRSGTPEAKEVKKEIEDPDGEQGEEGVSFEVYKTSFDGMYVKLTIKTDSYGDNERITGIQFVKPTTKTVSVFEPVS